MRTVKPQPYSVPVVIALLEAARGDKPAAARTLDSTQQLTTDSVRLLRAMIEKTPAEKMAKVAPDLALGVALAEQPIYRQPALRLVGNALTELPDGPSSCGARSTCSATWIASMRRWRSWTAGRAQRRAGSDPVEQGADVRADGANGRARDQAAQAAAAGEQGDRDVPGHPGQGSPQPDHDELHGDDRPAPGKRDQANDIYRKLIEVDPANWQAYNNLAWNLVGIGPGGRSLRIDRKGAQAGAGGCRRAGHGGRHRPEARREGPGSEAFAGGGVARAERAVDPAAPAPGPGLRGRRPQGRRHRPSWTTIVVAAPTFDQVQQARERLMALGAAIGGVGGEISGWPRKASIERTSH